MPMKYKGMFWLHIKKSGGTTIRKLLDGQYREVRRVNFPINFIQADPSEYNDVLNNYRVVLGEYQFRRAEFARKYLYPDTWDELLKFAYTRDPEDRCLSMFFYLFSNRGKYASNLLWSLKLKKNLLSFDRLFHCFLDLVEMGHQRHGIEVPLGPRFTTHTTDMWSDVTDSGGQVLLDYIFRLEDLSQSIKLITDLLCVDPIDINRIPKLNVTSRPSVRLSECHKIRIRSIYAKDYELYEGAYSFK